MTGRPLPPHGAEIIADSRLTVGVTGHRPERLGADGMAQARDELAHVLGALTGAMKDVSAAPRPRLVSALAAGTDGIAADAALALGWALDAILPFPRGEYEADFTGAEALAGFRAHLAAADAVLELPGERSPAGAAIAYERAGRVVLAQSDILIAVWDGDPARGKGGTAQIMAEAVAQHIPVIHIDAHGKSATEILWSGLDSHDLGHAAVEAVARAPLTMLPAVATALLCPPRSPGERAMLQELGQPLKRRAYAAFAYPLLLAAAGVRGLRRVDFRAAPPEQSEAGFLLACERTAERSGGFGARVRALLAPRYARADAIASYTALLFRSGFVANFTLAALAVLLALLALVLPAAAKPVLTIAEALIIATILILTRTGKRARWHERWLDFRQLAERLRCLALSAQIGDLNLREGRGGLADPGWIHWYARATGRELGLPSAIADKAYLGCVRDGLADLLDDQIAYHRANAKRMHKLDDRLHRLGTLLFALTALACVGILMFEAAVHLAHLGGLDGAGKPLAIGATIVSAALPAIGAALYGIRMQGDFSGVAARGESLAGEMAALREALCADRLDFEVLTRRIRRAADLMTSDLAHWRLAYRGRPLSLPG